MCRHVYEIMGAPICPLCNKPTHETNWEEIHRYRKELIASGKAVTQGWWSI
jgi:hypothetical protein